VLVDAYGLTTAERRRFLTEIAYVQAMSVARIALGAATGDEGMNNIWWEGRRVGVFGSAMRWLSQSWAPLEEALLDV
jgi:hypothetical protein